jgi:hypothetical protein
MVQLKTYSDNYGVRWCFPLSNNTHKIPKLEVNMWVHLLEPLTVFCYGEALLLCQNSDREWVAWISDHGEANITILDFCIMP